MTKLELYGFHMLCVGDVTDCLWMLLMRSATTTANSDVERRIYRAILVRIRPPRLGGCLSDEIRLPDLVQIICEWARVLRH